MRATKPAYGRVGIIDPPWAYREVPDSHNAGGYSTGHQYAALDTKALATLPVAAVMNYGFLWAVTPMIEEAYSLIRQWGMTPVTGLYWLKVDKMLEGTEAFDVPPIDGERPTSGGPLLFKPQYGVGYWFRGCVEPIVLFKKPGVPSLRVHEIGLLSPNGQHSRKPNSLHEMIENPKLPFPKDRIELFARRPREGWTCLGDEIDGRDIRDSLAEVVERDKAAAAA